MPYVDKDWPHALADWDADRLARHAAHAARFVAAGWMPSTASIVAFDLVVEEDEAGRVNQASKKKVRECAREVSHAVGNE